ncbi:hypothetical protein GCK32_015002 [Trichostrongylus colubriformis]|uniref:Uncharacterized protein n=1 Tax=Trichostrongylus colubriformis TaxID=6319 RepID=A0AAN8FJI2_TRICO
MPMSIKSICQPEQFEAFKVKMASSASRRGKKAEKESPLALTSAGHSECTSAPIDSRLYTTATDSQLKTAQKTKRESVNVELPTYTLPKFSWNQTQTIGTDACSTADGMNFDAKFQIKDVDTQLEHTLTISSHLIGKNLKSLFLNRKYCRL